MDIQGNFPSKDMPSRAGMGSDPIRSAMQAERQGLHRSRHSSAASAMADTYYHC
ncbi:hypothetical protein OCAR_7225 [Afipia carboxidovorans OM5]|nr:hypothetical protein OCAR_7225 [Afipia carboxidovorans OM5]